MCKNVHMYVMFVLIGVSDHLNSFVHGSCTLAIPVKIVVKNVNTAKVQVNTRMLYLLIYWIDQKTQ
jgi:hypothetical protein